MDLMNLAQQFLGGAAAQNPAAQNGIMGMMMQFVQNYPGGLPALMQKFEGSGMAAQVQSWISTSSNQPVTGAQVEQAMGSDIAAISQQTNLPTSAISQAIAQHLPILVDQLTPSGAMPDHTAITNALNALKDKLAA
jgi:uncharacterized protein YidB (DUF937 family)